MFETKISAGTKFYRYSISGFTTTKNKPSDKVYTLSKDINVINIKDLFFMPGTEISNNRSIVSLLTNNAPSSEGYVLDNIYLFNDINLFKNIVSIVSSAWFTKRVEAYKFIVDTLNKIGLPIWNTCASGLESSQLRSKLSADITRINAGAFGQIFMSKIGPYDVIIKESWIHGPPLTRMTAHKQGIFDEKTYPEEARMAKFLTKEYVLPKICPNFLCFYYCGVCARCDLKVKSMTRVTTCEVDFMEKADGDLKSIRTLFHNNDDLQMSLIYQLLIALYYMQEKHGIFHEDIKNVNVFYSKTPDLKDKFFKYIVRGKTYYVKNCGYVFYIGDFGIAHISNPDEGNGDFFGERNGKITIKDGKYILTPLQSTYWYKKPHEKQQARHMLWDNGFGTRNDIKRAGIFRSKDPKDVFEDIVMKEKIDYTDMRTYPPFEFFGDIQDVLKIVTGGIHSTQPSNHDGLQMSPRIRNLLQEFVLNQRFPIVIWKSNMASYLLADLMLDNIYTKQYGSNYTVPENMVCDTFGKI